MNRKCNMVWRNLTISWAKEKDALYIFSFVSSFIFCDSYALGYLTLIIQHARFSQLFGLTAPSVGHIYMYGLSCWCWCWCWCVRSHNLVYQVHTRTNTHWKITSFEITFSWIDISLWRAEKLSHNISMWVNHYSFFMKNLWTLCGLQLQSKPLISIKNLKLYNLSMRWASRTFHFRKLRFQVWQTTSFRHFDRHTHTPRHKILQIQSIDQSKRVRGKKIREESERVREREGREWREEKKPSSKFRRMLKFPSTA